jgi:5-methyltetrahydrofolate--homocysteine methyltransferase
MATYEELQELVITGDKEKVPGVVNSLLGNKKDPMEIISKGLIGGMDVVGVKFKAGDMFIPEVMASAHALKAGMAILKPLIVGDDASTSFFIGKYVIGTVEGDIHSIGKSIVAMLLEASGFQVIDLGVDVSIAKFLETIKQEKPDVVGMSALLTPTVPRMRDVVEALKEAGIRDTVKIMVGGAPVNQDIADSLGADCYAPEAQSAVEKARALIGK